MIEGSPFCVATCFQGLGVLGGESIMGGGGVVF